MTFQHEKIVVGVVLRFTASYRLQGVGMVMALHYTLFHHTYTSLQQTVLWWDNETIQGFSSSNMLKIFFLKLALLSNSYLYCHNVLNLSKNRLKICIFRKNCKTFMVGFPQQKNLDNLIMRSEFYWPAQKFFEMVVINEVC